MRRMLTVLVLAASNLASAAPEPQAARSESPTAVALVEEQLVRPLVAKEAGRSKFSRARPPAAAHRVRVIDPAPQRDSRGKAFVRFAVDERFGWFADDDEAQWSKDQITGCAYLDSREVLVQRGSAFHPAASKLGKKTKAAPAGACTVAARVVTR